MSFTLVPYTERPPIAHAQLVRIEGELYRRDPPWTGPLAAVDPERSTRYRALSGGAQRYDVWIVNGWLPLVVFAPDGADILAWWGDQDDAAEGFADADAIYAAYEALMTDG